MNTFNMLMKQYGLLGGPSVTIGMILSAILMSFVLGMAISYVYKKTHSGFSYGRSFLFTMIIVTIVVSLIMMVIQSNVALSLGLVGSLSIIRFRTVLKDAKDMAYLFWVICVGLAVGSGNYLLAVISVIAIGGIIFMLERMEYGRVAPNDYIMVLQSKHNSDGNIAKVLDDMRVKWKIRSTVVDQESGIKESRYSLSTKLKPDGVEDLIESARKINGVLKVSLLSPDTNVFV